jgi:hypothetical protein
MGFRATNRPTNSRRPFPRRRYDPDADMILVAQAESLNDPNTIIATTNVAHLSRFFPADLWMNITP